MTKYQYHHLLNQITAMRHSMQYDFRLMGCIIFLASILTMCLVKINEK